MDKETLTAVHDSDLEGLLQSLGVLAMVQSRGAKCKYCHDAVGLNNLAAIFPEGGEVKFVCAKPQCIADLLEARSGSRGRDVD